MAYFLDIVDLVARLASSASAATVLAFDELRPDFGGFWWSNAELMNGPLEYPGTGHANGSLGSGTPDPSGPPTCTDYAFFDTVHPTTQVAALLGGAFIAAVPEPGTGILLAFGLIGLALRRRA